MAQNVRVSKERPSAYWETLRERMDAGEAVNVVNRAVHGEDIPSKQLNSSMFYINKL